MLVPVRAVVYAEWNGTFLVNCEEYDYAEEYLAAEIALYGACSSCGGPCAFIGCSLCLDCEREERAEREERYNDNPLLDEERDEDV